MGQLGAGVEVLMDSFLQTYGSGFFKTSELRLLIKISIMSLVRAIHAVAEVKSISH